MTIASIDKSTMRMLDTNKPVILTGIAAVGVLTTAIFTAKGTFQAADLIRENEYKDNGLWVRLPNKERLLLVWQAYIPAVSVGAVTLACLIGAQSVNSRRQALLISGYTLSEAAFREYREKAVDAFGVQKEQKIRDDIAKDHVAANPVSSQVIITGIGEVLCYDTLSGRYFNSDMETLRRAQNDINALCINDMYASQNDFYRLIGLPINGYGEEYGWSTEVMLDLQFSTVLSEDGRPCISIDYRMSPIRGYYKMS